MLTQQDQQQNFLNGLKNAQELLAELDNSFQKSRFYERSLFRCKSTHSYLHGLRHEKLFNNERSLSVTELTSRSPVNIGESRSTISIVCLQYQYEELTKRYECLLQTYNDRCQAIKKRDSSLQRMRELTEATQSEVTLAHQALLTVGQKYLDLKDRHVSDKRNYEDQIMKLKQAIHQVSRMAKKARSDLDAELSKFLASETDSNRAALLAEIKRCNKLIIENMQLKQRLQGFMNIQEEKSDVEKQ